MIFFLFIDNKFKEQKVMKDCKKPDRESKQITTNNISVSIYY